VAAAATRAIRLLDEEPGRRRDLLDRAREVREALAAAGLDTGAAEAQIVPIIAGTAEEAVALSARLTAMGCFVPAIRPPSVPEGRSLVRASLSWHHTADDLASLVAALVRHAPRRTAQQHA
jgi:7-keto-8-aminopelargonate synthetase-like enzyme